LLVVVSIPLTLAVVFIVALLFGESINRITLFALILSLGLLVDSSTVVIENIVRHLNKDGERRRKSGIVINAVNEVGPGLFMSTVTTILAFVPMAFVTGMMGPYMGKIPFFVPVALVASLFISLTLNPWMASGILKEEVHHPVSPSHRGAYLSEKIHYLGVSIISLYERYLLSLLSNSRKRRFVLEGIAFLIILSFSLPAFQLVKFRMLPKADREQFFLYIDMPRGTFLEKTFDVTLNFERELLKNKNVKMVQSFVGTPPVQDFNGLFRNDSSRNQFCQATLRVGLTDPDDRDISSSEIAESLRPVLLKSSEKITRGMAKLKLVETRRGLPFCQPFF